MDEKLRELVRQWHIKAENDLATINNEFGSENTVTDSVCFHAQQAVEKYLKSFLIANQQPFRNTHSITEILRVCIELDPDFRTLDYAVSLTTYAVELRYPDDFFITDLDEAKEAYRIAKEVKSYVLKKLQVLFPDGGWSVS